MELGLHGADPIGLYRACGISPPSVIYDFSTNTNVLPCPLPPLDMPGLIGRYPQGEGAALQHQLAAQNGVEEQNILLVNGTNEAIYLIASYFAGQTVAVLQPTYAEYGRALHAYGVNVIHIFALSELPAQAKALFICNPNNPTGSYRPPAELAAFAASHPRLTCVIDEAYRDFLATPPPDAPFAALPNVLVLRSLTKIYHLSGLRIGYLLCAEDWRQRLSARQPSWSVNGPALALAAYYLRDADYLARTREFYAAERPRVTAILRERGFAPQPSEVNFFLLPVADDLALIRHLLHHGVVVRHTRNFPGLDGSCIRIGLRRAAENDILISALTAYPAHDL